MVVTEESTTNTRADLTMVDEAVLTTAGEVMPAVDTSQTYL
jgi:hypothetical protein